MIMFVCRSKADGAVVFISAAPLFIDAVGLHGPVSMVGVSDQTHEVIEAMDPPFQFIPGMVRFWGDEWSIVDQEGYDAALAAMQPPEPPLQNEISDRQFFQALAMAGMISQAEALEAVKTGTLPAAFEAFISALPDEQEFPARMLLSGATTYSRSHPLTDAFGAMNGMTPEQVDDLWRMAAAL